jgi:protein-S-isoprenylcysteine O-methyltransferase Ste14
MKIAQSLFRYRVLVAISIVVLGFWEPFERMGGRHPASTWLVLSGWLAQTGILTMLQASETITALAILLAVAAAAMRTWGTAYLGGGVMLDSALHGECVVADGPYRYLRNPLYLGSLLNTLALCILMPPGGAVFVVVLMFVRYALHIRTEEQHLLTQQGAAYRAYQALVPRWIPRLRTQVSASGIRARWGQAFVAEIYVWGMALTYAALAWRYNTTLLLQGVLISFGLSLVLRTLVPKTAAASA